VLTLFETVHKWFAWCSSYMPNCSVRGPGSNEWLNWCCLIFFNLCYMTLLLCPIFCLFLYVLFSIYISYTGGQSNGHCASLAALQHYLHFMWIVWMFYICWKIKYDDDDDDYVHISPLTATVMYSLGHVLQKLKYLDRLSRLANVLYRMNTGFLDE